PSSQQRQPEVLTVETALHDMSRGMPYALAIWLTLVTLILAGCAVMVVPALTHWYRQMKERAEVPRLRRVQLAAEVADLRRYAEEVAVAAARSAVTAHRREAEWVAVCQARAAAFQAFAEAAFAAAAAQSLAVEARQARIQARRATAALATGARPDRVPVTVAVDPADTAVIVMS